MRSLRATGQPQPTWHNGPSRSEEEQDVAVHVKSSLDRTVDNQGPGAIKHCPNMQCTTQHNTTKLDGIPLAHHAHFPFLQSQLSNPPAMRT
jgi:hypothetical protein